MKKVKTGIQKCNDGIKDNLHGFLTIDGQGYGLYPTVGSFGGVMWGLGQINPDDPSAASCSDVELDDDSYDINKFRDCVKTKVEKAQQNPPTYSIYMNNCRQWRNSVISACKQQSAKTDQRSGGLWEQYGP